ncbi:MAG: SPFH domain-containing protein [Planctomycetota bacterium]
MPDNPYTIGIIVAALFVAFLMLMMVVTRYKRCPSNRVLVVYGKVASGQSAKCLHGGGAFIWPLIQDYAYIGLDPIQIEIPLKGALSIENIRVNVPSVFTVAVGTQGPTMQNAAIRLLGLSTSEIMKQAEDIIFGQLRQVIASMLIEDINRDREKFLESIQRSLEPELEKIGLVLINVNITDITDESGYIEAIGRKAASEAIQQALVDVAVQEKKGAIGVAENQRERQIQVANAVKFQSIGTKEAEREQAVRLAVLEKEKAVGEETARFEQESMIKDAEREMRIQVASANAKAVTGENLSKAQIADVNATLKVKEAEAYQIGETRKREAEAGVLEAQYHAETKAALAMAAKQEAEKRAELEAVAKAQKAKVIVDAEAVAERRRIEAEGEASAIFARLDATARGQYEILAKKGEGLRSIVQACGGSHEAFQMLMLEHLDHLSETAAKAISNIKFDKVIVWDGGNAGGNGSATSGFLKSLGGAIPPMMQIMKDVGGVEMPEFFGRLVKQEEPAPAKESKKDAAKPEAKEGAEKKGQDG